MTFEPQKLLLPSVAGGINVLLICSKKSAAWWIKISDMIVCLKQIEKDFSLLCQLKFEGIFSHIGQTSQRVLDGSFCCQKERDQ